MRGWTLDERHVFTDDGISASRYSKAKARPDFDRLLTAVESGDVDAIVMAEGSRLSRKQSELWSFIERCQDRGVTFVVGGRDADPNNDADLTLLGVEGALSAAEVERGRRRTLRGTRQAAAAGRPAGRNQYGYARVYDPATGALTAVEPVEDEVAIVREIFARVLAGDALIAIARDLNNRGELVPHDAVAVRMGREPLGAQWGGQAIRRVARTPAFIGKRTHRGTLHDAIWPAVISEHDFQRAQAILTDPSRRTSPAARPGALTHWLTGMARCGACGTPLSCHYNRGRRAYNCDTCGKVSRAADPVETMVETYIFEIVNRPDILAAIAKANDTGDAAVEASANLDKLTARRDEVRKLVTTGALPAEDAAAILRDLAHEIEQAQAKVTEIAVPRRLADVIAADIETKWETFSAARKRTIADALLDVEVLPLNGRKTRRFLPEYVRVSPKGAGSSTAIP